MPAEIKQFWDEWLDPKTKYRLVRSKMIVPLGQLKFTPIIWGRRCWLTRDRSRQLAPF